MLLCALVELAEDFLREKTLNISPHSLDPVVTAPLSVGHEDCVVAAMDYVENHE